MCNYEIVKTQDVRELQGNADNKTSGFLKQWSPEEFQGKIVICVDMDGVLARWRGNGERYYSAYYGEQYFHVEHLYHEGYFEELPPNKNMVEQVKRLCDYAVDRPEIEVAIFSSYLTDSPYALAEKNRWLNKYLPGVYHRIFTPCGISKALQVDPDIATWMLLDDLTDNLNGFKDRGMLAGKILNGINDTHRSWVGPRFDFESPTLAKEVINYLKNTLQKGGIRQ